MEKNKVFYDLQRFAPTLKATGSGVQYSETEGNFGIVSSGATLTASGQWGTNLASSSRYYYVMSSTSLTSTQQGAAASAASLVGSGSYFDLSASVSTGGTGYSSEVVVTGVGSIGATAGSTAYLALKSGEASIAGSGVTLKPDADNISGTKINNATLNFSLATANEYVKFSGGTKATSFGAPTLSAGSSYATSVTLSSVDTVQTWVIEDSGVSLTSSDVVYGAMSDATVTSPDGKYLNFNVGVDATKKKGVRIFSDTNATTTKFGLNSTVISGDVGIIDSAVAISKSEVDLYVKDARSAGTLTAGSNGGVITFDALTSGGSDVATVSAEGIVAVENLKNASWSNLASTIVGVGEERWALSNTNGVTLTGGDTAGHVAYVAGLGSSATASVTMQSAGSTFKMGAADSSLPTWQISNTTVAKSSDVAVFDATGTAVTLKAGTNEVVANGVGTDAPTLKASAFNGDSLVLAEGGAHVTVSGTSIVAADSIAAGTDWLVYGKGRTVSLGSTTVMLSNNINASDSLSAAIRSKSADATNVVGSIASLSGNVTLDGLKTGSTTASLDNITVMGTEWSFDNLATSTVVFDSLGAATIGAGNAIDSTALSISGADGASVQVVTVSGGTASAAAAYVNGHLANYTGDTNGAVGFVVETTGNNTGIKGINDFGKGAAATIQGDNDFTVAVTGGNTYSFANGATGTDVENRFYMASDTKVGLVVTNLDEGANYNVTGGNVTFVATGANATQSANVNTDTASAHTLTLNGTNITVTSDAIGGASISANDTDGVATISGVYANSTIKTDSDQEFAVIFNNSQTGTGNVHTFNVNDVSLTFDSATSVPSSFTMNVNQTSSGNFVTIKAGDLGSSSLAAITATKGVYQVGNGSQVTINDDNGGFLYWSGNALTGEDLSVYNDRMDREQSVSETATLAASYESIKGYQAFSNINNMPSSVTSGTVAGYESGSTLPVAEAVDSGINIYGNTSLSAATSVTLESDEAGGVNITANESPSVKSAIIDFTGGTASLAVIGQNGTVSANHTVLASDVQSTIMFGDHAGGSNMAKAGTGGAYMYNTGAKASLLGNTGSDTIYAGNGDFVEGGADQDFFFDSGSYTIRDYSASDKDVIRVTQVDTKNTGVARNQISVNQNVIQIGTGGALTLGTAYDDDDATQRQAIISSDISSSVNNQYIAWSSPYGESTVDVSSFVEGKKGAIVLADENENGADSVVGSANADTIYAGANDTIDAGAGADYVVLSTVSAGDDNGIAVSLSAGANTVEGWSFGFLNAEQGNSQLLETTTLAENLTFKMKNGHLVLADKSNRASVTFADTLDADNGEDYDILYGDTKIRFIEGGVNSTITSADNLADLYTAEKSASLTFGSGIESSLTINLGNTSSSSDISSDDATTNAKFVNISAIDVETEANAVVLGTSSKETVKVGGSVSNNATKVVSLGSGNDVIISTGTDTDAAGHTFVFGSSDGKDTISNFSYYAGSDADPYYEAADTILLTSSASVSANQKQIEFAFDSSNKVVISRDSTDSTVSDNILKINVSGTEEIAKIGRYTSGSVSRANNFTYDSSVQHYYGNATNTRDTLTIGSDIEDGTVFFLGDNLSLKNSDGSAMYTGKQYDGIGAINASAVEDVNLYLFGTIKDSLGTTYNNTLIGGGTGSYDTLWGAANGDNLLIGGNATDVFLYGGTSNDVVSNGSSDDVVWLYNLEYQTISGFDADSMTFTFANSSGQTDGTLQVSNSSSDISYRFGAATTLYTYDSTSGFQVKS